MSGIVTTGSQQGLDLVGRVLLDPGDACWWSCQPIPARSRHSSTHRPCSSVCRRTPTASNLDALDETIRGARRRPSREVPVCRPEFPESDRPANRPAEAAAAARVGRQARRAASRRRSIWRPVFPRHDAPEETRPIKADDARAASCISAASRRRWRRGSASAGSWRRGTSRPRSSWRSRQPISVAARSINAWSIALLPVACSARVSRTCARTTRPSVQ